jgi:hypothetical protein
MFAIKLLEKKKRKVLFFSKPIYEKQFKKSPLEFSCRKKKPNSPQTIFFSDFKEKNNNIGTFLKVNSLVMPNCYSKSCGRGITKDTLSIIKKNKKKLPMPDL